MNILHVVNVAFTIPYFLGNQLCFFSSKDYKEYIICSPSVELKKFSEQYNFKYAEILIAKKISIYQDIKAIIQTIRYIRDNSIDVVVGHTPKGAMIAMIASYLAKIPKRIYFRHGLVYETSYGIKKIILKNVDRLTARLATKIVCVSPSVYNVSLEDKLNAKEKQCILSKGTCNGIDIRRFDKKNIKEEKLTLIKNSLAISAGDFIIGYTGRLVKDKGIEILIKAIKEVKRKYNNIKLLLVGVFEKRDGLANDTINMIQHDADIIYTGYIENSQIEYYYALMDVFILPSYREGFPTSVLEASSMEVPVITTKVTGCIDSIIENKTGIFINNNVSDIVAAISELYSNVSQRVRLGKNGREFVINNFDEYQIWSEIEKLYIEE